MNSDDLDAFARVADGGSISAAALDLGCDASTLSRRMNQLEARLGVRLFRRSGRGVDLTPPGESPASMFRRAWPAPSCRGCRAARSTWPCSIVPSSPAPRPTSRCCRSGCTCWPRPPLPLAAAQQDLALGRLRARAVDAPDLQRCVALAAGRTAISPQALWTLNTLVREVTQRLVASCAWPGATWTGACAWSEPPA